MLTATQVRQACALLRWRSSRLARSAGIDFDKAWKARDDQGIVTLNGLDLRAILNAFERNGIEFGANGAVRLRKAGTWWPTQP